MIKECWNNQWQAVEANPIQEEHSQSIPNDFLQVITSPRPTLEVIKQARTILDFGFGTGHLCHVLSLLTWGTVEGVEISSYTVDYATKKYGNGRVKFTEKDIRYKDSGQHDLIVTSNTLEHFQNPFEMIDLLLTKCKHLLILVPNEGTACDDYIGDGGNGHVYSFGVESFQAYQVVELFTFFSRGWTEEPNPLQLCVLLKGQL
jgi:2-polyprenyl-3-methyl-5-hydroxy-6-metoxy-1,4-benzoquinol methylase